MFETLTNHDLYLMPKGVYRTREIVADNYLYPVYFLKEDDDYVVSTSVYSLIRHKKRFVRNPRFQTTFFYRPTFLTIDSEINRVRTMHRRSTYDLKDAKTIIPLGAQLIQDYITEIEHKFPGYVHVVLMGGKDSQNLVLAKREAPWVVVSGEPNAPLNEQFIKENNIVIERFVSVSNEVDDTLLREEIVASDCFFDVAHFRWVRLIGDLVKEYNGKVVLWIGTSGDGVFARNGNHRDKDYYAVHDLHVGMSMGIWHQMFRNLFDIPVVSPYQSPRFLNELFYRFDPYFVDTAGDVRSQIGDILLGRPVKYPNKNPTPEPWWSRKRSQSIAVYVDQLRQDGIPCVKKSIQSSIKALNERMCEKLNYHSSKRRTRLSKILFPFRQFLARYMPGLRIRRHDMTMTEIR